METTRKITSEEKIKTNVEGTEISKNKEWFNSEDREDKRVLYQIATGNLMFFKNLMLNLTYYTVLIYSALFFVYKMVFDKITNSKIDEQFKTILVIILSIFMAAALIKVFHLAKARVAELQKASTDERKRIKMRFRKLLKSSLCFDEIEREVREYDNPDRDKQITNLYDLTNMGGLITIFILIISYLFLR